MNSNVSTPKPSEQSSATPSSYHGGMDEITPTKSDTDGEQLLKTPVNEMKDNVSENKDECVEVIEFVCYYLNILHNLLLSYMYSGVSLNGHSV